MSVKLIEQYYQNNLLPFFNSMDADSVCYGPARTQFLRGRSEIIKDLGNDVHSLRFSLNDMQVSYTSSCRISCCVILFYKLTTHHPDGRDTAVLQRTLLHWIQKKETNQSGAVVQTPYISVCHFANLHDTSTDDFISSQAEEVFYSGSRISPLKGERIHFRGKEKTDYYTYSDTILWIEAAANSRHSIVHLENDSFEAQISVASIAKHYPHLFLRCHQSYLINPLFLHIIRRFMVTLTDGTTLPISAKQYTVFKEAAKQFFKNES